MDDAATLELFRKTLTNLSSGPMREKLQRELVGCLIKELGGEDMKLSVEYNRHDKFVDVILDVNSFDDIVHSYLKDADDPGHNLATYVNQWIYRSTCGMTFPCERFYNSTSLNGQTLFNQWYCVVSSCEAIGRNVLGTSCDAGGGNASFFFCLPEVEKDCGRGLLDFQRVYQGASSIQSEALDIPLALHGTFDEIHEKCAIQQQARWFKTIP
jgi:hypothetical protein